MARIVRILRGVMIAAALTLAGMALMALFVILKGMQAGTIGTVNQIIKLISLMAGVWTAVGRGGEKGLLSGAVTGILYILIGYGFYCLIDGSQAGAKVMAIEEAAGAVIGGIFGMLLANMKKPARSV